MKFIHYFYVIFIKLIILMYERSKPTKNNIAHEQHKF